MGETVTVSEVIGAGPTAHRLVRVGSWELRAPENDTERELLIADADLAPRLEMHLHKLRELSRRYERSKDIAPRIEVLPTVGETPKSQRNLGGRPARRRFYNRADALFLVTRSEAPGAVALTKQMIRVFLAAMEGLLVPAGHLSSRDEASLRAELADARAHSLAGVVGKDRAAAAILGPIANVALLHPKGKRAGLRWVNNKLRNAVGHNGAASAWELLPLADLAKTQRALAKLESDLAAQAKAARLACGTTSTRPAMEQLAFAFALGLTLARGN